MDDFSSHQIHSASLSHNVAQFLGSIQPNLELVLQPIGFVVNIDRNGTVRGPADDGRGDHEKLFPGAALFTAKADWDECQSVGPTLRPFRGHSTLPKPFSI